MITNNIASIMSDTKRDKVYLVLKEPYIMRGIKLTEEEEMALLAMFSMFVQKKVEAN